MINAEIQCKDIDLRKRVNLALALMDRDFPMSIQVSYISGACTCMYGYRLVISIRFKLHEFKMWIFFNFIVFFFFRLQQCI